MLWTILVALLALWAIGFLGGYAGSLTNLFLGGAIVVFVINLCSRPGYESRGIKVTIPQLSFVEFVDLMQEKRSKA
jgi:hypothetical protein